MICLRPRFAVQLTLLAGTIAACVGRSVAAPTNEIGRPVLRHYTPGEHMRAASSHRVIQDASGMVFFANGHILLSFDGTRWNHLLVPTDSLGIQQFATAADGTIFMSGGGVLGYLQGQGAGAQFASLAANLPPHAQAIGDLRYAAALGQSVYFSDAEKILVWRDQRFTVIPFASPAEAHGARLHRVDDTIYVTALTHGLGRIVNDRVERVSDDAVLRENQVVAVEAGEQGSLVLLTAERGFFQVGADRRVAPLPTEMNRWLAGKRIFCARRLNDGSRVVGFSAVSGDGGIRFAPDGSYVGPIDMSIGLIVKTVRDFFQDHEGGLWLGMDTGAARLEWPSPVSIFDSVNGLGQGAVHDVLRHEGVLYAATSEGFFRLVPADDAGRPARFERLADVGRLPESFRRSVAAGNTDDPALAARAAAERLPHFARTALGQILRVREETDANGPVLWVCGSNGLARIAGPGAPLLKSVSFATQLSAKHVHEGERLPTKHPVVTFHYAAPRQRPTSPVTYQTRLTGLEDDWSDWSARRERSFANLPSGRYRFEVRARDAEGVSAPTTGIAFVVLAPWWRAPWAITGYAVAAAGLVGGLVQLRTRALRQRATQLEAIVDQRTRQLAERTAELSRQNVELVRLHQLESEEKIAARLAEEKARLEVLRYQLNPHFLFNTLASISSALPSAQSTARTMVERLANFCRLTLHRSDDREWTTLGEEMKLLRVYLEIEQSRWGDLLDVAIACDPTLETERLPHFLLLPLVENALKYGRATSPDRVGLRLAARRGARSGTASRSDAPGPSNTDGTESRSTTDEELILEVSNTGTWIEPTAKKTVSSLGIGLDNLRERLVRYYPRSHQLNVAHTGGWVTVTLRLNQLR